ncbi:MAG: pitrilysin family protein [Pseudomonadota bacterium]
MIRPLLTFAAAALALSACQSVAPIDAPAQSVAETIEPADPYAAMAVTVHDGDFAEIQQFTTPGGVSVWLVSEPSIPILSVQMAWNAGSVNDPDGLEGLSDAVAYQMNEGAGDLDALAFQRRMEELNMSFGCSASNDWTGCSATMLTDNASDAMDLVALAFTDPRFDEGPFERHRREDLVSINQRETQPRYLAAEALETALYPDHVYARDISEASVNARTRALALAHKDRLMTRDRLLVTAVGAMSPAELAPLVDAAVSQLPESAEPASFDTIILPEAAADPIIVSLPQPQSLVRFVAPGPARDHLDFFAATVLNYTVGGGGFESRMMKTLRVEKGLTYGVGTGLTWTSNYLKTWSGSGQTKNESAGEFVAGVKDELSKVAEAGITAEELADAKAYIIGSYPLGFDSNAKIAGNMMSVRQQVLGIDYFDRRNAAIAAVTLEDANRVAAEWLSPENFTFVVVGEPQGIPSPSTGPGTGPVTSPSTNTSNSSAEDGPA